MITLIAAAAVAAAQPAGSPANPPMQHAMEMGDQHAQHAAKEKCCCEDMAAKHEGHGTEHSEHGAHQQ